MKITPTKQQKEIIKLAKENSLLKVSAGSGCAKSSTLKLIADEIQEPSLYLAFNKSMATEAKGKFPHHVDCMTTHSGEDTVLLIPITFTVCVVSGFISRVLEKVLSK